MLLILRIAVSKCVWNLQIQTTPAATDALLLTNVQSENFTKCVDYDKLVNAHAT